MERLLLLGVICLMLASRAWAQDDSIRYRHGIPVTENDTTENDLVEDRYPHERLTRILPENLPSQLRRALERKSVYTGWEKFPVYFNENTNLYIIRIKTDRTIKVFGLNHAGKGVTYDEMSID
ncbi:MAG TPA: hypothetical protein VEB86_15855 [Chryseosolibacter sp.]|nr:hypothetical protein [Chryseosolibacter sp.]